MEGKKTLNVLTRKVVLEIKPGLFKKSEGCNPIDLYFLVNASKSKSLKIKEMIQQNMLN